MLPMQLNPNLTTLPNDLLKIIYNHLPLQDQQVTAPRISRIWRSIAFQISGESMNINDGLDLSGKEFEIVKKICNTTNFISAIRKASPWCSIGHGSCGMFSSVFSAENAERQSMTAQGHHNGYDGCSEFFNINWNPSTLKITFEGNNWGDFRSSYAIQVDVLKFTYKDVPILKTLSPRSWGGFSVENRHLLSWQRCTDEAIKPLQMNEHIKHALSVQLKMYVNFLTHLNMIFLSKINLENEIILKCNSTGRIIETLPHEITLAEDHFILRIAKKRLPGNFPISYIMWTASDHSSNEEHRCRLASVLRWCVYSSTTQSLGKKMGLKITVLRD